MHRKVSIALVLALAAPAAANAAPVLIANGQLTGTSDLSGLTGNLESGIAANTLGGLGSGYAYAGGTTYLALPDRGPNATVYNPLVDSTTSYISRFHTLTMALTPNAPGSPLAFSLTPKLDATTLLYSETPLTYGTGAGLGLGSGAPAINDATHYYFSGRSDNFGPGDSSNPANARFDPESLRVSNDGTSVFISDEYGPYVRQFDRASGKLIKTFALPANLASPNLSPSGDYEINNNPVGRVANKGMEGLAITPDGKTLVGTMQAPLEQDQATSSKLLRFVTIDIASGKTKEYAYKLSDGSGVSDIVALNDHQFLVDERDGKGLGDTAGSKAKIKQVFLIDTSNAVDVTNMNATQALANVVTKQSTPFLDLVSALAGSALALGPTQVPSKIEGIAFGQDVLLNGDLLHTLWITNDNDFLPDFAGGNQFYVFGFTDRDLPGFIQQPFGAVPEPASWAMMIGGFALMGAALRRRTLSVRFA